MFLSSTHSALRIPHSAFAILLLFSFSALAQTPNFEAETIDSTVAIGYGVVAGDVDGDGDLDLLLADKKQFVWYRNPEWTRFVMVEDLTERDNVALAAHDINGDGQVEVAVGAQWNPGETSDAEASGSVHYLMRPDDPTQMWTPVELPHDPTVHRMLWVPTDDDAFALTVLPLHGQDNVGGEGEPVRLLVAMPPEDPSGEWSHEFVDLGLHRTHNYDVRDEGEETVVLIGGAEGIKHATADGSGFEIPAEALPLPDMNGGAGEVRFGTLGDDATEFITAIEPMHGTDLAVYVGTEPERQVLDTSFVQGHALATGDLLGLGRDQIVAGWRNENADGKVGLKLYVPDDEAGTSWTTHWIDDNGMATEDVKLADLDGDGRLDIIAAGRATNNLKIYWNRSE